MVLIEYVEPVPEFESDRHIYIRIYENEEINSDVARQVMQIMLNENMFDIDVIIHINEEHTYTNASELISNYGKSTDIAFFKADIRNYLDTFYSR